jgi:hypothetical protein
MAGDATRKPRTLTIQITGRVSRLVLDGLDADTPEEVPEAAPCPQSSDTSGDGIHPHRRTEDLHAALAITAGLPGADPKDRRADASGGRRSSDPTSQKARRHLEYIELRAYWAANLGRPDRKLEELLKMWLAEGWGLPRLKGLLDRVRELNPHGTTQEQTNTLRKLLNRARTTGPAEGEPEE